MFCSFFFCSFHVPRLLVNGKRKGTHFEHEQAEPSMTDDLTRSNFHKLSFFFFFFCCGRANEWNDNFSNWRFEHLKNVHVHTRHHLHTVIPSFMVVDWQSALSIAVVFDDGDKDGRIVLDIYLVPFGGVIVLKIMPFSFHFIINIVSPVFLLTT